MRHDPLLDVRKLYLTSRVAYHDYLQTPLAPAPPGAMDTSYREHHYFRLLPPPGS